MKDITVHHQFDSPIETVFAALAKHDAYKTMFWPTQVERVVDAADKDNPDGVGSVRRMGLGPIKPIREKITIVEPNQRIEYQMEKNPLFYGHIGILSFKPISVSKSALTYQIKLQSKVPFLAPMVLLQLKIAVKLGLIKLAKQL